MTSLLLRCSSLNTELSYEELDQCATNIARRLVSLGLHSQQGVPLY
jgi:non-ribosomal peptide synthetase component E (peptide arylation enzyme)